MIYNANKKIWDMGYSGEMLLEFHYIILFTYYMYIFKFDWLSYILMVQCFIANNNYVLREFLVVGSRKVFSINVHVYFHNTNLPFLPCLCIHLSPWDVSPLVLWPLMPRGTCKFPCWLFPNVPCGNKSWQDLLVWCPNQIVLNIKALMDIHKLMFK